MSVSYKAQYKTQIELIRLEDRRIIKPHFPRFSLKKAFLAPWCFLGLLFDTEDGSSTFIRNDGELLPIYVWYATLVGSIFRFSTYWWARGGVVD
jgi:hypothetical protein